MGVEADAPPGGQRDAAEQNCRRPEAHSLDLNVSEQHPSADQEEQDENHVPGQVVQDIGVRHLPGHEGGAADQKHRRRDAYAPAFGAPEEHPGADHEEHDDNRVV